MEKYSVKLVLGLKPFNCDVCDKTFPSIQNLNRHKLTHADEKPFKCDMCDKGFLTVENLNRHKRIHTGEKPYECEVCGKRYAHSTTLKEHQQTHTGDKPFACDYCIRDFAISKLLFRHVRIKHPENFEAFKSVHCLPRNLRLVVKRDLGYQPPVDYIDHPEFVPISGIEDEYENDVNLKEEISIEEDILIKEESV